MSNSPTLNVALQASSCTTPRKPTSGQVSASGLPKAPRSQQTPLDAMPLELGDQVWEFDVKTTRSMLSPKRLRSDVNKKDPYPPLDSFACFVDDPEVQQAIKSMPQPDVLSGWDPDDEKVSYKPTATFLNNCVDNCYDALAKLRQSHEDLRNCWWPTTLKFFVYDKETKDGVEGSASPLKPHLVGVASDEAGNDPGASGILLPVEVQKNWTEIIKQAATYARAMVSAAPLRLFSVVIGVNHERETLRFLIYHRGGLTMSHEISLQEPQGRHDVQSIIFAILLWRNHEDAGFPSFTTGTVSLLPSRDKDKPVTLITNKVLFKSLSIRGRGTYVLWATIARRQHTLSCDEPVDEEPSVNDKCKEPWRHQPYTPCYTPPSNFIGTPRPITYEQFPDGIVIKYSFLDSAKRGVETHVHDSCSDQFGVPTHLCTFEACRSDGGAFSNSFLLPSDGSFEEHRWRHAFASSRRLPDRRTLQVIVTVEKGASLEHCKSAAELFKCVLHAQIGWLVMMGMGGSHNYLHHDVSCGDVLRLDSPAHRPVSSIRKQLHKSTSSSPDIVERVKNLSLDSQGPDGDDQSWTDLRGAAEEKSQGLVDVIRAAERLKKALSLAGLSTECMSVLIDSDMAAPLECYFSDPKDWRFISGTPEFMSEALIAALREVELTYVQNPVDDLKSFMWTTVWGAVFNPRADGSQMQNRLVHWRRMLRTHERLSALSAIEGSVPDDSSPILEGVSSLIRMWRRELEDLEVKFGYAFKKALNADQKLHVFYQSALEGVALYAELLHELRETLGLKLEVTQ